MISGGVSRNDGGGGDGVVLVVLVIRIFSGGYDKIHQARQTVCV